MDPIFGAGAVALLMWYKRRRRERREEINRLVEEPMADRRDLERMGERQVAVMNDLPSQLQPGWMENQIEQNLAVFKQSPGVFESWLITLRDRYRTPREIEIYENAERKLRARMSFLKTAIEADVAATTAREQHEIQSLKVKTDHATATRDYAIAAGTATLEVENKLMTAELENEKLRKQLEEARAASGAAHRPLVETREAVRSREREEERADAELKTYLASERARRAGHAAQAAESWEKKNKTENPPAPEPPRRPPSDQERKAERIRRENLKASTLSKVEQRMRKELTELKAEFGPDSLEYKDREAYWNNRLITLRETPLEKF